MKGWLILKHSLRQVFGNLNGALRVSAVLYLVQCLVGFLLGAGVMASGGMMQSGPGPGFLLGIIATLVVAVVTGLWIAVGWHRYVLMGEEAQFVPTFRGDRIWAYLLRSLGYGVILVVIGAVLGGVVGYVLGTITSGAMLPMVIGMGLLVYLPIIVIAFRLTSDLPATALGADVPFMSGWAATQGQTGDLVVMALILVVAGVVLEIINIYLIASIPGLNIIWQLALGWVQMMVGVSILTTLYGHYIEKRALV